MDTLIKVYSVTFKNNVRYFKHLYEAKRYIHIIYMSDDNIKICDFKLKTKMVTEKSYNTMTFFY